ncbi:hypothetical protein CEXT_247801 [Caerostris extrusa]|uniref:Uncharacterized protein n=1 Tax=Caerostris extrusa TaxID=172846 RepID=A0AAV4MRH8_CAEEX|nr:hypothetical protein CEXT_247801 [Caerostris extrusa]
MLPELSAHTQGQSRAAYFLMLTVYPVSGMWPPFPWHCVWKEINTRTVPKENAEEEILLLATDDLFSHSLDSSVGHSIHIYNMLPELSAHTQGQSRAAYFLMLTVYPVSGMCGLRFHGTASGRFFRPEINTRTVPKENAEEEILLLATDDLFFSFLRTVLSGTLFIFITCSQSCQLTQGQSRAAYFLMLTVYPVFGMCGLCFRGTASGRFFRPGLSRFCLAGKGLPRNIKREADCSKREKHAGVVCAFKVSSFECFPQRQLKPPLRKPEFSCYLQSSKGRNKWAISQSGGYPES